MIGRAFIIHELKLMAMENRENSIISSYCHVLQRVDKDIKTSHSDFSPWTICHNRYLRVIEFTKSCT